MRGADRVDRSIHFCFVRFIPTCVGQTVPARQSEPQSPVHPHVRGADPLTLSELLGEGGSSPRAWGRHLAHRVCRRHGRFIPTCVGQTLTRKSLLPLATVHPHVRGADALVTSPTCCASGSSPRAWGRRCAWKHKAPQRRFIPTCVGQTHQRPIFVERERVHPHVRGADHFARRSFALAVGSSPRAWGRPADLLLDGPRPRFIPTCVGQTWSTAGLRASNAVHPHVRGADQYALADYSPPAGSSPRAWGRPEIRFRRCVPCWFIPTCVGQTVVSLPTDLEKSVHPHVRGADLVDKIGDPKCIGSSPRAWGRRSLAADQSAPQRFIPTCVGQTLEGCLLPFRVTH